MRSADGSYAVTHITSAWAGVDQLENAALQGENVRFTFAEAKFPLLDNDGLHGMRQRELAEYFEAGDDVDIRVTFMEYGGGSGVKLYARGPGMTESIVVDESMTTWAFDQQLREGETCSMFSEICHCARRPQCMWDATVVTSTSETGTVDVPVGCTDLTSSAARVSLEECPAQPGGDPFVFTDGREFQKFYPAARGVSNVVYHRNNRMGADAFTKNQDYPINPYCTNQISDVFRGQSPYSEEHSTSSQTCTGPDGTQVPILPDQYAQTIEGFFKAPVDGDYTFYLAADDWGECWISTDTDPNNLYLINRVQSWTRIYWNFPMQVSEPIALKKNEMRFMRCKQMEGGGGDFIKAALRIAIADDSIGTGAGTIAEVQEIQLYVDVVRELHELTIDITHGANVDKLLAGKTWEGPSADQQDTATSGAAKDLFVAKEVMRELCSTETDCNRACVSVAPVASAEDETTTSDG